MSKTWRAIIMAVVAGCLVAAVLWFTPTSDYIILPGVTENLNTIIHVEGGRRPPGKMLMVAVTLDRANLLYWLYAKLTPYGELLPAQELLPPGTNLNEYLKSAQVQMDQSHRYAEVAGLRAAGYPALVEGKGVEVYGLLPQSKARGRIQTGDVITQFDGKAVGLSQQLENDVLTVRPGATVHLTVLRHGRSVSVSVPTIRNPSSPSKSAIGIYIGTYGEHFYIPRKVKIDTGDISGPSAGMMFALEILQQLRPTLNLTHGATIAGTGTIDPAGNVGEIGGSREKLVTVYDSGARVFLVPTGNYPAVMTEARRLGLVGKIRIVPVSTLSGAVHALEEMKPA